MAKIKLKFEKSREKEDLQRTEKWHKDREGRWTGSQLKNLMSASRSGGKISWHEPEKLFLFGNTALKYIYENAMERKRKRHIDKGNGTLEMRYGTAVEPLIQKSFKKYLKKNKINETAHEVAFKVFDNMDTAGVSSDMVTKNKDKKVIKSVEMKACTNWGSHFERTFDLLDEKSNDFWQIQGQMAAWNVKECYYVVSEPPKNISEYVCSDNIKSMYKQFKKECKINVQIIEVSQIHVEALYRRITIAEEVISRFIETNGNLRKIMSETIDFFKEKGL